MTNAVGVRLGPRINRLLHVDDSVLAEEQTEGCLVDIQPLPDIVHKGEAVMKSPPLLWLLVTAGF
jgi:hypothetical protein